MKWNEIITNYFRLQGERMEFVIDWPNLWKPQLWFSLEGSEDAAKMYLRQNDEKNIWNSAKISGGEVVLFLYIFAVLGGNGNACTTNVKY